MRVFLLALFLPALAACIGPPGGLPQPFSIPDRFVTASLGPDGMGEPIEVAVYERGDGVGRPLIFVHGTPGSAAVWADIMAAGDSAHRMIAIDRPGFGASGPKYAIKSLADQARAILPLLEEAGDMKPILIGHSLGGPVVAKAAAMFPEHVGGLVILAGAFDPALEKIYGLQYLGESFLMRWALPRALRNANRELIALEGELEILETELPELALPVAIVHGTRDRQVPYENVLFLEAHLPEDSLMLLNRIEGGNHFLPWNGIDQVWQAIEAVSQALADREDRLAAPQPRSSVAKE